MTGKNKKNKPPVKLLSGSFKDTQHQYTWKHLDKRKRTHVSIKDVERPILTFQRWLIAEEVEVAIYSWMCGVKRGVKFGKQELARKIINKAKIELD